MKPLRKLRATVLLFALSLAVIPSYADALSDAKSGAAALDAGDYPKAVTYFTSAIGNGLAHDDLELAYVMRAKAYLGERRSDLALFDLKNAEYLVPNDRDITILRQEATGSPAGP